MQRGYLDDLRAFKTVGRERSFTRAAAKLGVSQSALSHTIRGLEGRLGVRLLARNTRGVNPTEAGERLLRTVAPRLDELETELANLSEHQDRPAGIIRITAGDHPVRSFLWPKLAKLLAKYPDINVEIALDNRNVDIVDERYDAGVRLGEQVAKDMIAVRISPDVRFAVVGSPSYFANHPAPVVPGDLVDHKCINLRLPTYGGLYAWELENNGHEVKVRVEGQLVFNSIFEVGDAAVAGFGVAYVPEDVALPHILKGNLTRVLEDWCVPWSGYHLYYPLSRQSSAAFDLLVNALRHRD
ncbi:LysR family transcriptional regulator [Bradyrhizobium sp. UFLA05-112]